MVQWYLAGGGPPPPSLCIRGLLARDSLAGMAELSSDRVVVGTLGQGWSSGRVVEWLFGGGDPPHPPTYSMVSRVLPGLELSDPHRATSPPAARQKARGPMICVCLIAVEYRVSTISEVVASRCLRRGSPVEVIESSRLRLAERPRDAIPGVGKSERSEIPHGLWGRRLPQEGLVLPDISRSETPFRIPIIQIFDISKS